MVLSIANLHFFTTSCINLHMYKKFNLDKPCLMSVSRAWALFFAVVLFISLAFLGARPPKIKKSSLPRPTRKALIESPIQVIKHLKTAPTISSKQPDLPWLYTPKPIAAACESSTCSIPFCKTSHVIPPPLEALLPSRASPAKTTQA